MLASACDEYLAWSLASIVSLPATYRLEAGLSSPGQVLQFTAISHRGSRLAFVHLELVTCISTAPLHCRDYEAIAQDFVTLQFMDKGTDLRPIMPVLAKVR